MKNIILNKIGQVIIGAVDWFLIGACVGTGVIVAEKVVYFVEDKIKEKKNAKL